MAADPELEDVNQKALEAIISGHYGRALAEPVNARARAQWAYTVASATAAALVTAGILSDLPSYPWPVKVLGVLALSAWVVTAGLFMRVARIVEIEHRREGKEVITEAGGELAPQPGPAKENQEHQTPPERLLGAKEFAFKALRRADDEASAIDQRLGEATGASWIALILTVLAFLAVLLFPLHAETVSARLVLTDEGQATLEAVCDAEVASLEGELEEGTLGEDFAVVRVAAGECTTEETTVLLAPKQVEAVVSGDQQADGFPWIDP